MAEDMTIDSYLAKGGVLSNPSNVPPRYRAELMKLMATFVDSELAGAAGFADIINDGPGIKERIAAARIVMEKTDHAGRVLRIMGEFGADTGRYVSHHPWTERLPRDADIGTTRVEHDMRLAVFNYPLDGWADAVMMNLLMGLAVTVQLDEFKAVSYQPLADAFRAAASSEGFREMMERQFFELDVLVGEAADRQGALMETVSVDIFNKNKEAIGAEVKTAAELGLPAPEDFESWWPPADYTPPPIS